MRGVSIAFSFFAASTALKPRTEYASESERERKKDGKKRRVRLVTLCRANFGTVLENFSLAAYRGKPGEISTWPIVLHYGSDEVHLPLVRWEEICIFGWDVANLTFAQMSYTTLCILSPVGPASFNLQLYTFPSFPRNRPFSLAVEKFRHAV